MLNTNEKIDYLDYFNSMTAMLSGKEDKVIDNQKFKFNNWPELDNVLHFKGNFKDRTIYELGDAVRYKEDLYICMKRTKFNTKLTDTNYWAMLVHI